MPALGAPVRVLRLCLGSLRHLPEAPRSTGWPPQSRLAPPLASPSLPSFVQDLAPARILGEEGCWSAAPALVGPGRACVVCGPVRYGLSLLCSSLLMSDEVRGLWLLGAGGGGEDQSCCGCVGDQAGPPKVLESPSLQWSPPHREQWLTPVTCRRVWWRSRSRPAGARTRARGQPGVVSMPWPSQEEVDSGSRAEERREGKTGAEVMEAENQSRRGLSILTPCVAGVGPGRPVAHPQPGCQDAWAQKG